MSLKIMLEKDFYELEYKDLEPDSGKPVDVTENYIRIRIRDPKDFKPDSFRIIDISKKKGIRAVIGRLKAESKITVQSYLFDKKKWTVEQARRWVEEHKPKQFPADTYQRLDLSFADTIKALNDEERIFEGLASTDALDRMKDRVDPQAFEGSLETYMENPVMFFGHRWMDRPIGKVLDAKIMRKGLKIKAYISETADDIWTLIKEGILKGLSIGFNMKEFVEDDDGTRTIIDLELLEISVVNIPANPQALITTAKTKGLEFHDCLKQEEDEMENTEVKELKETVSGVKAQMDGITGKLEEVGKFLSELKEAASNAVTRAELKELEEKSKAELFAQLKTFYEEQVPARKKRFDTTAAVPRPEHIKTVQGFREAFSQTPAEEVAFAYGFDTDQVRRFQRAGDDLYLLHNIMIAVNPSYRQNPDPSRLKLFPIFQAYASEFAKALDTSTAGSGAEFIWTAWSAEMQERIEIARQLAKFFLRITMPAKNYEWPIRGAKPTVYIKSEGSAVTASEPATAKVTFTAKDLGVLSEFEDNFEQDSIIPALPWIKADIASALVGAEEEILINGDDSGTHQDSDVTDSSDRRKLLKGLRKLCNSGAKNTVAGSLTASDIVDTLKLAGKYAVNQKAAVLIASTSVYFQAIKFTEVTTIDKWGPAATYMKGALTVFLGYPFIPSEFVRQDLNTSGVYDGVTTDNTELIFVNTSAFKIGDRKLITFETDKDITTGTNKLVATQRWDFQKMVASADNPIAIAIDITS